MSYHIVRGDLGPAMPISLTADDSAIDLSAADTIELHWLKPDGTVVVSELTEVDATLGTFLMEWEDGDTDQEGAHFGHVVVTTDDSPETYPNDGSRIIWFVNPTISD